MRPEALSKELRERRHPFLRNRRGILGCALAAAGSMAVISLYQMGVVKHLPEPPLPLLDADKVDASPQAYQYFQTPDGVLGLGNYAVTAALAAMGGADRARQHPWIPLLLGAKVLGDAAQAGKLSVDQWRNHRAFCTWCLFAAGATFATVPLALPEARAALRRVLGRDA